MSDFGVIVGIDVSKDRLDVFVRPDGVAFSVTNDEAGRDELVGRLGMFRVKVVALEASGGYERAVVADLVAADLPVRLLNPGHVRKFAKAGGRRAKNDRIDAAVIAHYAEVFDGPACQPDAQRELLAELVGTRSMLVEQKVALGNRRRTMSDDAVRAGLADAIAGLERLIGEIEQRLADVVAADPSLDRMTEIMTSVTGVGPVVSWTLLAHVPELGALGRKPLASLAGLAPFDRDSGAYRGQRRIEGGRKPPRDALYMAAQTACRYNPDLAAFYDRLRAKGKKAKVAIVAVMRKLLVMLNALIRDNRLWTPDHVSVRP